MDNGTTPAPVGQVYVCGACGKRSKTRYGFDDNGKSTVFDHGWDESCMMHAELCYEQTIDGKWQMVPEDGDKTNV